MFAQKVQYWISSTGRIPGKLPPVFVRTHLKNVFWPNIFVGASFQILDIQQYASGLKLGPAAILNQNPIFEMVL
jgi:hypothetical protein